MAAQTAVQIPAAGQGGKGHPHFFQHVQQMWVLYSNISRLAAQEGPLEEPGPGNHQETQYGRYGKIKRQVSGGKEKPPLGRWESPEMRTNGY